MKKKDFIGKYPNEIVSEERRTRKTEYERGMLIGTPEESAKAAEALRIAKKNKKTPR